MQGYVTFSVPKLCAPKLDTQQFQIKIQIAFVCKGDCVYVIVQLVYYFSLLVANSISLLRGSSNQPRHLLVAL